MESRMWRTATTKRVEMRELPGGGFAAIDVTPRRSPWGRRRLHGALIVERRPEWRRAGHSPPIVAVASGPSIDSVLRQLLPILQSNAALGSALIDHQREAV